MNAGSRDDDLIEQLRRDAAAYFLHEVNHENGLVPDNTRTGSPASISATGFGLTAYISSAEHGLLTREEAVERTLTTLRFFANSPQGKEVDATGYQGFYYHFLDMHSGRRTWRSELSTIDTAILMVGILAAATYFNADSANEDEIRRLAKQLSDRVNWRWALHGRELISHGWKPESGFIRYRWSGYCEALVCYLLALGSTTFAIPAECYTAWTSTYDWREIYGHELVHAGPLFIHQMSHAWVDLREIQDQFMRDHGSNYFLNSQQATFVQQKYAELNPRQFEGYGTDCWGITASDGPGPATQKQNGRRIKFFGYIARGVPDGPDDGTVAPWAVAAALPFAPDLVLRTVRFMNSLNPSRGGPYGTKSSFNLTYQQGEEKGWTSDHHFGINQGPALMMIENYSSGLFWKLMHRYEPLVRGLRAAGFTKGWLE